MIRSLSIVCVALMAAACGGISDHPGDDAGGGDSAKTDAGPGPGPDCPTTAPDINSTCTKNGIQCEYGNDPRWICNNVAVCSGGHWDYADTGDQNCPTPTPSTNSAACPATFGQGQTSCTATGTVCNYSTSSATQFCVCDYLGGPIQEDGGMTAYWYCGSGEATGCPASRPHIGAACSQPHLDCNYDVCGSPMGLSFQCSSQTGTWVEGIGDVCAGAN